MLWRACAAAIGLLAACGASGASGPFGTLPGASRSAATSALKDRGFCPPPASRGDRLVLPRCPKPGLEVFTSRVVLEFGEDRLVRATRIEAYAAEDLAMRRWHDLVGERSADGRKRVSGGDALLRERGALPDGAVSWVVWDRGTHLHAVLLVRPASRETFEVNEVIVSRE